jgi:NADPH-dependent 2,4-dienoyl-CoA reductase/sulfur reductase-like enzyme
MTTSNSIVERPQARRLLDQASDGVSINGKDRRRTERPANGKIRISIGGAGIGGLTLALALRRRGLAADVYEQALELREIGAAATLSASGSRELERLGCLDAIAASAPLSPKAPRQTASDRPRNPRDSPPPK